MGGDPLFHQGKSAAGLHAVRNSADGFPLPERAEPVPEGESNMLVQRKHINQNGCNYSLAENQQVLNLIKLSASGIFPVGCFQERTACKDTKRTAGHSTEGDGQVSAEISAMRD
jgi:hypothetical protein